MKVTPIKLEDEMRRIAREIDEVGSDPNRQFACSKYDSDFLREAASVIELLRKADRVEIKVRNPTTRKAPT